MTVTDSAHSLTALKMAGSVIVVPSHFGIGSGSGLTLASVSGLRNEYVTKRVVVTSTDMSTEKYITWTGDWNSVIMSGLQLGEFGIFNALSGGSIFDFQTITTPVTFDGTNELQIQLTWNFY